MSKPRPTLEWLHVCDYAFRDEQGKVGMIGLFDTLASAKLPGRLPMFCVAFGVTDGVGEYNMGLQVIAPSGKVVDLKLPPIQLHNKKQIQKPYQHMQPPLVSTQQRYRKMQQRYRKMQPA